ncbi:hypothetical protein PISMIDRAFT_641224 [Pisolithus microcarpus 441]|uniref:Uncharacterized protein n=1 Tax=Pisolithus microcarpus 441 TaxID=765257 RepID=A0A0C9YF17_9AGAM|nr:hypothetical protein BKA83DRAFT_641224 [Pisolithus microcarpus]KIK15216.1 hypothetical protein PISMIDRAFT_641224 [Pisolithus microcarpus 441]
MEGLFFNVNNGFLEGIVHGYKAGILTQSHYDNLTQCKTLEDLKTQLSTASYGNFLMNKALLTTTIIWDQAAQLLINQSKFLHSTTMLSSRSASSLIISHPSM